MSQDNKTCLVAGCDKEVHARGVCHTHYKMLTRMVANGEIDWKTLEEKGVVLAPSRVHNPEDRNMLQAFIASKL